MLKRLKTCHLSETESEVEREAEAKHKEKLELARKNYQHDYKIRHKQITGEKFNFSDGDTKDKAKE